MKGIVKLALSVVVAFVLVTFAGYKMGLYPAKEFKEKATKDVHDEVAELIEAAKDDNPGLYDGTKSAYEQLRDYLVEKENVSQEEENQFEHWTVTKTVDGDTIYAKPEDGDFAVKIRYIGIDTPESVHADESKNTKEGKIASNRNAEILKEHNNEIYLEFDAQKEDNYGRTLAYVYVKTENGGFKMVQDILLEEGMCRIMTIQPNSKYSEHFYELQVEARENKEGFWGTEFFSEE